MYVACRDHGAGVGLDSKLEAATPRRNLQGSPSLSVKWDEGPVPGWCLAVRVGVCSADGARAGIRRARPGGSGLGGGAAGLPWPRPRRSATPSRPGHAPLRRPRPPALTTPYRLGTASTTPSTARPRPLLPWPRPLSPCDAPTRVSQGLASFRSPSSQSAPQTRIPGSLGAARSPRAVGISA